MRTEWRHFRAPPTHFRSRDVINVIFGITAITPLFFKLRLQVKTKMIFDVISDDLNHKNNTFLQKKWAKNVFQKYNHGYKNVACLYLSNGAR